jgi:hypothetical protein
MTDPGARDIFQLLDGTRDRSDLCRALARQYPGLSRQQLLQQIDVVLSGFARHGLLMEMAGAPNLSGMRERVRRTSDDFEAG